MVNTVTANTLASQGTRSSATMVLPMQDEWLLLFHGEGFQPPESSQYWEMIENAINYIFMFPKIYSAQQGLTDT